MSKTTVDPNALMMRNADTRKSKKEQEIDARVASVADRLGPGRIKKRAEELEQKAETVRERIEPEADSKAKKRSEASRAAVEEKRTTVDIPVDLIRDIDKVLFARKMRGEKTTFKDFLVSALRAAVAEDQVK